jgi:SAM-dependent methyltransferase
MTTMSKARGYNLLASYYDVFFTSHRKWWDLARQAVLGETLTTATSGCDLACGTGSTAVALASQGLRMFAVDVSPTMCRLTRLNAKKAKVPVHIIHADMRKFQLPEKVDVVLCEFSSLNHIPDKSDLKLVARAASRALAPGGCFYFDVNSRKVFQEQWSHPHVVEQRDAILVLQGGYDTQADRGWMMADCFIRNGHHWRRRRERVESVCWSHLEIQSSLRQAGFDKIRPVDASELQAYGVPPFPPGWVTFYVAQKAHRREKTTRKS